jgi:RNA recognition motif-containing protein
VGHFLSRGERSATSLAGETTTLSSPLPAFTNVFVKNFDEATTTEHTLREMFEKYGEVTSVKLGRDAATGKPLGYGFVNFNDNRDAAQVRFLCTLFVVSDLNSVDS